MRHLLYAYMNTTTLVIQTDFSAQYSHKAAWTNTCEHPPTSNMDVFVVTRVVFDAEGKPTFITDVWRIFSAAKGSSAFHNACLHQITEYYRTVMQLELVYVCTDGCRGQYKGRRNFYKISTFAKEHAAATFVLGPIPMGMFGCHRSPHPPSQTELQMVVQAIYAGAGSAADATVTDTSRSRSAAPPSIITQATAPPPSKKRTSPAPETFAICDVKLIHLFACGHHFKGPHDGYGKDAKFMPKTAERHQRVRIATTFDLYNFNATHLPTPRKNVLASEVVAALSPLPPAALAPLNTHQLPADWASVLNHVNMATGSRCLPADSEPPPTVSPSLPTPTLLPCTEEAPDIEDLAMDDLNARPTVTAHEEDPDSEPEDTSAGDFDFEFDDTGARVLRAEQMEDTGMHPSPSASAPSAERPAKAPTRSRKARVIRVVMKEAGCEEHEGGEVTVVTQRAKEPGIPPHAFCLPPPSLAPLPFCNRPCFLPTPMCPPHL